MLRCSRGAPSNSLDKIFNTMALVLLEAGNFTANDLANSFSSGSGSTLDVALTVS
jgi:hypothetical protein